MADPSQEPDKPHVDGPSEDVSVAKAIAALAEQQRIVTGEVRASLAAKQAAAEASAARDLRWSELYDGVKTLIATRYFGLSLLVLSLAVALVSLAAMGLDVVSLAESGVDAYRVYQGCEEPSPRQVVPSTEGSPGVGAPEMTP